MHNLRGLMVTDSHSSLLFFSIVVLPFISFISFRFTSLLVESHCCCSNPTQTTFSFAIFTVFSNNTTKSPNISPTLTFFSFPTSQTTMTMYFQVQHPKSVRVTSTLISLFFREKKIDLLNFQQPLLPESSHTLRKPHFPFPISHLLSFLSFFGL